MIKNRKGRVFRVFLGLFFIGIFIVALYPMVDIMSQGVIQIIPENFQILVEIIRLSIVLIVIIGTGRYMFGNVVNGEDRNEFEENRFR